ncbi:hypothetical protein BDY21DRAFT_270091, partial [Lineolata rhizophorae]
MKIPQSYVQKCKVVAHVFQLLFIFIGFCLTIAVFTKGGETGGPSKYYFALCFLTIPGVIYLIMTPMWSRALRFANAYAFVAVDVLYTIFWFAAFIAVALWNSSGIRNGAKDRDLDEDAGNCTTFKYGSESRCNVSKAAVGIGVVIFIFFLLTAAISSYYLVQFRKHGHMPYQRGPSSPVPAPLEDGPKDVWSASTHDLSRSAPHDDALSDSDESDSGHGPSAAGGPAGPDDDEYALLPQQQQRGRARGASDVTHTEEGAHPGVRRDTFPRPAAGGYGDGGQGAEYSPGAGYSAPSALSPGGYDDYR